MTRRMIRMALGAALVDPVLGALSSPASGATVVMGSTLTNDFDSPGQSISAPTVSAQFAFDPGTSPNPVVSPVNGVITGWKVKSADDGALYTLKVLRPTGPVSVVPPNTSNFTAIGSVAAPSAIPAGTAVATPTGVVFSYPSSLPIGKGDYIGVLSSGDVSDIPQHTTGGIPANVSANNFAGQPADGTTAPLQADEQHDLLLQATIEYTSSTAAARCAGKKATIVGTAGNDTLIGTSGADVIAGLGGRDKLKGLNGKDILCGGKGKDRLIGGRGRDRLLGQGGRDVCKGGGARDVAKKCEIEKAI